MEDAGEEEQIAPEENAGEEESLALEEKSWETEGQFVVMSTTDVHGKVWDENILNGTAVRNSLLNVSTAVDEYEEKYGKENVILLDNGDLYQGTPVSSYNISQYTQGKTKDINPMALALEQIGFDAAILGNHEFNYPWATMSDIYTVYICTVCNEIYHGNMIAASCHKYKDGVGAVCGEKESEKPEQSRSLNRNRYRVETIRDRIMVPIRAMERTKIMLPAIRQIKHLPQIQVILWEKQQNISCSAWLAQESYFA